MKKRSLNPSQSEAVHTTEGHVLVLAGAGSGKTSVLINRIVHLIRVKGIKPTAILGLTFTNKAAGEMRERISADLGKEMAKQVTLSTFHSFCFMVLKKEIHRLGYSKDFTIYDDKDIQRLQQQLEKKDEEKELSEEALQKELLQCMRAYNAVDFDGLLQLTCELFSSQPEVLARYQDQYQYVMIDEYQDTNPIQYQLASTLAKSHKNLFVVGDDDQAIYGWRGSEVKHILEFPYRAMIKLEQNYRSTQPILNIANEVIQKNKERHKKVLFTDKRDGDHAHLFYAPTEVEEAEAVAERIIKLKKEKNLRWSDFAILYRSNHLAKPFEIALMKCPVKDGDKFVRGIPYHVIQGTEFYERAEVKDFFAYLRVIYNPKDTNALLRIINYPRRGISIKTIDQLTKESRKRNIPLWTLLQNPSGLTLTRQAEEGIGRFMKLMYESKEIFKKRSLKDSIAWLVREISFKEAVEGEVQSEKAKIFKWENVKTCIEMASQCDENGENLSDFISSSMLDQQKQNHRGEKRDRVNLLTFHSAKGLEFPACFLVGLEDGILPHEKSLAEVGEEEERRLFYVALTRAKRFLTLSMAQKRTIRGKAKPTNPSRFLFDIPKTMLEIESYKFPKSFTY